MKPILIFSAGWFGSHATTRIMQMMIMTFDLPQWNPSMAGLVADILLCSVLLYFGLRKKGERE